MLCFSHTSNNQTFNLTINNASDATLRSMVASSLFADSGWWGNSISGGQDNSFGSSIRSLTDRAVITPERLEILRHEALRSLQWLKPSHATAISVAVKQQDASVILNINIITPENKEVVFNATLNS